MSDETTPETTVEDLVEQMRAEAARVRQQRAAGPTMASAATRAESTAAGVTALVRSVRRLARIGSQMPPLAPFTGLLRIPARLAARLVLYLARFLTEPQAHVNLTVLRALEDLAGDLQRIEAAVADRAAPPQRSTPPGLDALYAGLQGQFRGSREEIRERMRVYLPYLQQAITHTAGALVLDLGSGRGEWLELVRDAGWWGCGVESNPVLVAQCRRLGLEVDEADVLAHLGRVADASLAAVTAFHLLEHLPFEALVALIDHTVRVLVPGGVAIFETPDPRNLHVSGWTFHLDPTHCRPLPSPLLNFVVEARGLTGVEVLPLHAGSPGPPPDGGLPDDLRDDFYGPQDYAVIGWKA